MQDKMWVIVRKNAFGARELVLDAGVMLTQEQADGWIRRAGSAGPGCIYESVTLNVRG